jgi:hypothetical protein
MFPNRFSLRLDFFYFLLKLLSISVLFCNNGLEPFEYFSGNVRFCVAPLKYLIGSIECICLSF